MRTEQEIRKRLRDLDNETQTDGPFTELKTSLEKQRSKPWSGFLKRQKVY